MLCEYLMQIQMGLVILYNTKIKLCIHYNTYTIQFEILNSVLKIFNTGTTVIGIQSSWLFSAN